MTARDLALLVRDMRAAQARYFHGGRTTTDLETAKRLERQVDAACREILDRQARLDFDQPATPAGASRP